MNPRLLDFEELLNRAERAYLFEDKTLFEFPVRKKAGLPNFYELLDRELQQTQSLYEIKVLDYRVVKEGFARVSRPAALGFDAGVLLRHRPHLKLLKQEFEKWQTEFRAVPVKEFVRQNVPEALENPALTRACLEVFEYLVLNRSEIVGLLPRQIPHGQSTKLIGRSPVLLRLFSFWRGEPSTWPIFFEVFNLLDKPVEFRFYAPECTYQGQRLLRFHGVLAAKWASDYRFSALKGTLVIENFESFLGALPLARESLMIWGGGWRAAQLKELLGRFPKPLVYWGDIDKEGYEIFGYLKQRYPDLIPLFMDSETIAKYRRLTQKKERYFGPYREVAGLQATYERVCEEGIQIEQEQLNESWPFYPGLE